MTDLPRLLLIADGFASGRGTGPLAQSPERVRQFKEKADVTVFTPGSKAGIPVSILSS